jgi:hypothetical protein
MDLKQSAQEVVTSLRDHFLALLPADKEPTSLERLSDIAARRDRHREAYLEKVERVKTINTSIDGDDDLSPEDLEALLIERATLTRDMQDSYPVLEKLDAEFERLKAQTEKQRGEAVEAAIEAKLKDREQCQEKIVAAALQAIEKPLKKLRQIDDEIRALPRGEKKVPLPGARNAYRPRTVVVEWLRPLLRQLDLD